MTGKAVVPQETQLPATPMEGYTGQVGEYDERDFSLPGLYLVQPTSNSFPGVKPGHFTLKDGRSFEEAHVIILQHRPTRALWPDGVGEGRPLCASNDRNVATPFGDFKPYHTDIPDEYRCHLCPHFEDNPWDDGEVCAIGYAIIVALPDLEDEIAIFRIKGMSTKTFKDRIRPHIAARRGQRPKFCWTKHFLLSSAKGDESKGNFYELRSEYLGDVEEPDKYAEMAFALAGMDVPAVEEIPEEEGGED